MNSWDPSIQPYHVLQPRPSWIQLLVPPSALPLIIVLLLIFPIFILAAESLFAPVIDYIQSLLMPVNAGIAYTYLPILLLVKIGIFCLFTFTGVMLLLLKLSCLYHEVWSLALRQPHPTHTPYHADQQSSLVALLNWNIFRWYKIAGPFLGWGAITTVVGALGFWIFNAFTDFGFFTFQLQFTLGFFIMSVLGFFTFIAFFKGIWTGLKTLLGDVAAITEPEKPTQVIFERTLKLAFLSPLILLTYPFYALFYLVFLAEIVLLLISYDVQDLFSLNPHVLIPIGICEIVTLIAFIFLSGLKFLTYHNALVRYYKRYVRN